MLAETDVINMVSRGIATADILKGIHLSMAGGSSSCSRSPASRATALLTGGLALDVGLLAAMQEEIAEREARSR